LMFAKASVSLLGESLLNDRHPTDEMYSMDFCNRVLRPYKFTIGALDGLMSVCVGILYWITIFSIKDKKRTPVNADNRGSIRPRRYIQ
ncbi:hypothetical protein MKW94_011053, partial [Papaver nudicaule]|nr:hypothetical protein [Papaver nudicaule]